MCIDRDHVSDPAASVCAHVYLFFVKVLVTSFSSDEVGGAMLAFAAREEVDIRINYNT